MNIIVFCADSGLSSDASRRQLRNLPPKPDRNCLRLIGIYVGVITGVVDAHVTRHLPMVNDDRISYLLTKLILMGTYETIESET
jgi:hypothetical protein